MALRYQQHVLLPDRGVFVHYRSFYDACAAVRGVINFLIWVASDLSRVSCRSLCRIRSPAEEGLLCRGLISCAACCICVIGTDEV